MNIPHNQNTIHILNNGHSIAGIMGVVVCVLIAIKSIPVLLTFCALLTVNTLVKYVFHLSSRNHSMLTKSFLFYCLIMLLIFYSQSFTLPAWDGLSGPEGGTGTDDTFFYTQATGDIDMSRNGAAKAVLRMDKPHSFSVLLSYVCRIIALYKQPQLLDFLLVNTYVLSFIPLLCFVFFRNCSPSRNFHHGQQERSAYWLAMLHPNLWTDGLILIRDGWTATLFIAALLALFYSQLFRCALAALLLSYIRLASGISFGLCAIPLALSVAKQKLVKTPPIFLLGVACIGVAIVLYATLSGYVEQKDISFGRDNYVDGFIARADEQKGGGSALYAISNFPIIIRVPVSIVFFLCAPFIRLNCSNDGIIIPRAILSSVAGCFNIWLFKWWVQSFIKSWVLWRNWRISTWISLHMTYLLGIFLVATMSLQIRHKTMLLPLLCILAADGMKYSNLKARRIGTIAAISLAIANLINLFL